MNTDTPNTPATFAFDSHTLRVVTDAEGQPWFNANDVCEVLGLANPWKAVGDHVDPDDLTKREVIDSLGRAQEANHVNESGLYALVMGSRKPEAKRFKRWITSEVLPALRKTGRYAMPGAEPDPAGPPIGVFTVIEAVETARHPEARAALHGLLANHCRAHGLYVPVLAKAHGRAPRLTPAQAEQLRAWFWRTLEHLPEGRRVFDHSRSGAVEAYRMYEARRAGMERGDAVPSVHDLGDALRGDPRFIRVAVVNSRLERRSVKCWLFRTPAGAAPALVH